MIYDLAGLNKTSMLWRMISQTQAKSPDLPPREMFEVDSHFKGDTSTTSNSTQELTYTDCCKSSTPKGKYSVEWFRVVPLSMMQYCRPQARIPPCSSTRPGLGQSWPVLDYGLSHYGQNSSGHARLLWFPLPPGNSRSYPFERPCPLCRL